MNRLLVCAVVLVLVLPLYAQDMNPHEGQVFWLPIGVISVGVAESEKSFGYTTDGKTQTFFIAPTNLRMHMPGGQFVIVNPQAASGVGPEIVVDGKSLGTTGLVTFLTSSVPKWGEKITIEIKGAPAKVQSYRLYYTDDAAKLGATLSGNLTALGQDGILKNYKQGMLSLWTGNYTKAKTAFSAGAKAAKTPVSSRLFRHLARWADAQAKFANLKTGEGFYDLGLYACHNGFWDLAVDCFKKATELMPTNPDAWYMLGDALSYQTSDLDMKMEKIAPYYHKAAELYPKDNSNTWRNHVGLFKKLRVSKDVVSPMTDEQIAYVKQVWGWCADILAASSRGSLRMVNDFVVYDEEFDNSSPGEMDPRPFEGLFPRGSTETFMKFNGWGASMCFGHDCGPNRSAHCNIGLRGWEVMYHEWNHSLDWAMITGELGIGVPVTHASDSCGFQPVSSMGMGHHSCNRYYMTPGMYRYVRGSDSATTPYITDWLAWTPVSLCPDLPAERFAESDQTFITNWVVNTRAVVAAAELPKNVPTVTPKVEDGYVNLKSTWSDTSKNSYVFARTYVYSPKKQKVRMWVGADDNIRIWLNGKLIHKGNYWAVALFQEAKEKDQTAKGVMLEEGWNELVVQVTNMQHADAWYYSGPRPDQWGFSVRICDMYNREVPGLKYQSEVPHNFKMPIQPTIDAKSPRTYKWQEVADDYTTLLPQLAEDDLRAITGYKTLKVTNEMLFDLSGESEGMKLQPYGIEESDQKDVRLNNQLNWFIWPREMAAVVRYKRGSQRRDLLFLRPEAYEAYLKMITVSSEAKKLGINNHSEQVIGYLSVTHPDFPNGRVVLVVDTYLGNKLPVDEEDLLDISKLR